LYNESGVIIKKKKNFLVQEDVMSVSFDYKSIVLNEYAPQGQNINQHFCSQILKHLLTAVGCKRQQNGDTATDISLGDVPRRSAQLVRQVVHQT
jgi:hypothetical protein